MIIPDVTDDVAVHAMIASIISHPNFGQLNVLVSNAGIAKVGSLIESTVAERVHMFDVNAHGVMNTCVAAAKQMIKQGTGGSYDFIIQLPAGTGRCSDESGAY